NMTRLDNPRGDMRNEQRKEQVVPSTDHEDLAVRPIPQPLIDHAHRLNTREAAAEDDDPHQTLTTPRSPATTSPMAVTVSPASVSAWRARSASAARTITT